MATIVNVIFINGNGSLSATLFRNGTEIDSGSTITSGDIMLVDALKGDTISINGASAGGAQVSINRVTDPPTPDVFVAGPIMSGYDVLI